jgi:hypothetical protein
MRAPAARSSVTCTSTWVFVTKQWRNVFTDETLTRCDEDAAASGPARTSPEAAAGRR